MLPRKEELIPKHFEIRFLQMRSANDVVPLAAFYDPTFAAGADDFLQSFTQKNDKKYLNFLNSFEAVG